MPDADLAILLFWLTLFSGAVFETVKAETLRRRIGFAIVATIFLLSGIFWQTLKSWWPHFTDSVDSIARNPETWFIICVLIYAAVAFWSPKTRADSAAIEDRLKKMRAEIAAEIDAKITDRQPFTGDKPWKDDVESMGSALEKYVDSLRSDVIASLAKALQATPWKDDIARHDNLVLVQRNVNDGVRGQLDELQATVKTLGERFSIHERVVASGTRLLIRGIRARDDRRFILIPNDKIAMSLGKRLAEAKVADYPDATSWLADYQSWEAATRAVDRLIIDWTEDNPNMYTPLFKLERRHFANSQMPPDNIRSDDTIIPFMTVWHVQSSYADQRDGFFALLNERAVLPG